MSAACPCGFDLVGQTYSTGWPVVGYSAEWHRQHKAAHLAAFPGVDARTIEILDESIVEAVKREPTSGAAVRP